MSVRDLLRGNDERFLGVARGFSADDWSSPSLCERWSNHEVLAHMVAGLSAPLRAVTGAMLRHRGSFDAANAEMATVLAADRSPAELLDDYARLGRRPGDWTATSRRGCSSVTTSRMSSTWFSALGVEAQIHGTFCSRC